jgi:cation diffusion facilitator family transporter
LRATFAGLAVNVVFTAVKFTAGILGHSHALVADAVESLADIFSSVVVWRGLVLAAEPADEDHPYGHGKAEPLAAATVSTFMLLAAAWIVISAIHDVSEPHPPPRAFTLIVLGVVIVIKEYMFRFVSGESAKVESSAVQADAWHHRSDAITSLAAAIGITVALVGGKGYEAADEIAAIFAAGIIAWNGWRMLRPALNELMDAAPGNDVVENIRALGANVAGVIAVEKCVVRKMGYNYYVDMHVEVDPEMTVRESHEIAHRVKDSIRGKIPSVRDVLVHVEPPKPQV